MPTQNTPIAPMVMGPVTTPKVYILAVKHRLIEPFYAQWTTKMGILKSKFKLLGRKWFPINFDK